MRTVRRMRHWKQRFAPDAAFVWNKPITWNGKPVEIGDPIPEELANDRNRLRRFWEARVIQLADFSAPDVATGQAPEPTAEGTVPDQGVQPEGHLVHPDADGEVMFSRTDDEVDAEFSEANGDEELDPAAGDAGAADPEALVSKVEDRKWAVEGLSDTFPTKKAAIEAAQGLADAASDEDGDDPLES